MDAIQRFSSIKNELKSLSDKKIRLEERHRSEKERLQELINKITQKGYDPMKLSEVKTEKEKQLDESLGHLEERMKEISDKLNDLETTLK